MKTIKIKISFIFLFVIILLTISTIVNAQQTNPLAGPNQSIKSPQLNNMPAQKEKEMSDIHDIKKPEIFGIDPVIIKTLIYILIVIVVTLIIIFMIYYFIKKKKKITELPALISPEDAARNLLDDLTSLASTLSPKAYYFRLSAILREYIKARFKINAPEMTTEELMPQLSLLNIDRRLQGDTGRFLRDSDPIKFAGFLAENEKMKDDLNFVYEFVTQTTPDVSLDENSDKNLETRKQS